MEIDKFDFQLQIEVEKERVSSGLIYIRTLIIVLKAPFWVSNSC